MRATVILLSPFRTVLSPAAAGREDAPGIGRDQVRS
jgi:hypothetical protein